MNAKLAIAMFITLAFVATTSAEAQLRRGHKLIDAGMAPGVASQRTLMSNQNLHNHVQPVRLLAPEGSSVGFFANGTTVQANGSAVSVGVTAGLLYRFKIDFVANQQARTVYPSIELVDRLYPPQGLETQFPVPVVLTQDDLEQASAGKMVTKVVYLESAESAVVRRGGDREQPYFDVSGSEDPLHVAKGLGRPLVILRIGSRIPTADELTQPSAFNSSTPVSLPAPVKPVQIMNHGGTILPVVGSTSRSPTNTVKTAQPTEDQSTGTQPATVQFTRFSDQPAAGTPRR